MANREGLSESDRRSEAGTSRAPPLCRFCNAWGGELEQIQVASGHVSVQMTERYLGCKQRIHSAVNDRTRSNHSFAPGVPIGEALPTFGKQSVRPASVNQQPSRKLLI